jgi:hypothetical protein
MTRYIIIRIESEGDWGEVLPRTSALQVESEIWSEINRHLVVGPTDTARRQSTLEYRMDEVKPK